MKTESWMTERVNTLYHGHFMGGGHWNAPCSNKVLTTTLTLTFNLLTLKSNGVLLMSLWNFMASVGITMFKPSTLTSIKWGSILRQIKIETDIVRPVQSPSCNFIGGDIISSTDIWVELKTHFKVLRVFKFSMFTFTRSDYICNHLFVPTFWDKAI